MRLVGGFSRNELLLGRAVFQIKRHALQGEHRVYVADLDGIRHGDGRGGVVEDAAYATGNEVVDDGRGVMGGHGDDADIDLALAQVVAQLVRGTDHRAADRAAD